MSYIFNYNDFYNYYTNPSNVITDATYCVSLYYFVDKIKKMRKSNNPKCTYIIVNGIKIYISIDIKKNTQPPYGLHFSIPTMINDTLFDFHYHFGKRHHKYTVIADKQYINDAISKTSKPRKTRKNKKTLSEASYTLETAEPSIDMFPINPNENIIYFHKTIQHLTNNQDGFREHKNCYFQDNTNIQSINNIVCLDKDETIMGRAFTEFDKTILRQIMKRPFEKRGGKKFRNRKNTRNK
jgi:hypothetical protein